MKRDEIYNDKIINAKEKIKAVLLKYDYDWMIGFSGGKDSTVLIQFNFLTINFIYLLIPNK
ncbi:hypothetical protein [Spiroplasma sp. Moj]|uniref:hypothetical protein n=1 Tax=Spiroplasma sp. Moj TaxID=1922342 RepID=UPI0039EE5949|nr:hypothetical protein [Spiroplasma sp. Moj]